MTLPLTFVIVALFAQLLIIAARPHGWGPTIGAAVGVGIASIGGAVRWSDLWTASQAQWPAYVTLIGVMLVVATAEQLGLLQRVASLIEPRTRGPVKHAFFVTFVLAAITATIASNDAAILLLTPIVLSLLRTVYPRRNPKFVVPFAFAVFCAAGVAPLLTSNPMNLVFANHLGLGFNRYAIIMIPIAVAGWGVTYLLLRRIFRDVLNDESPALGGWTATHPPMTRAGWAVVITGVVMFVGYPFAAYLGWPLWPVAAIAGGVCVVVRVLSAGADRSVSPLALLDGITWNIFPFLTSAFVLALALQRVGAVDSLATVYQNAEFPLPTIGSISAIGSAVLNNHPMSVLNALVIEQSGANKEMFSWAALIGGDLGPRLLPIGSIASLLWFSVLKHHGIKVSVTSFIRIGVITTIPVLACSIALLWLIGRFV